MKKAILVLLVLKIEILFAGTTLPQLIASPTMPNHTTGIASAVVEQQNFNLWQYMVSGCFETISDTHIEYLENEVNVFVFSTGLVCASPPPPPHYGSIIEIEGLEAGTYDLNYYLVRSPDLFPPNIVDYPNHFIGSTQFGVINVVSINSSSNYSLLILILLLLAISSKKLSKLLPR